VGPVTVLDTQAVVAGLTGEPAIRDVETILRERGAVPMISAITLAETMDVLVRTRGMRVEAAARSVDLLLAGGLEVVPVDEDIGRLAGVLRARHWRRDTRPVSLADCAVLATAMIQREPLATADASLIGAARAEGHPVVVLPDSRGRRVD
jgi:PIN domain nuclease of toxin-antitoxin system